MAGLRRHPPRNGGRIPIAAASFAAAAAPQLGALLQLAAMKALLISGLALVAAGIFLILRPPHYASEQSVFKIGDGEARMQQERARPAWVGGAVLGAGVVLLGTGLFKRS